MDQVDQQMAQRVWQRVRGEPEKPGLSGLILAEYQAAADYQLLQRRIPAKAALFRQLYEDVRRHSACLMGIRALQGATGKKPVLPKPKEEPLPIMLRRCCGQSMKTAADYQSRTADPEYGAIFADLAREKQRHLRLLLEIVGDPTEGK